ncbi:MAG: hypothetical protein ACT4NL_05290 [Pseudomarimonas sp.]
MHRICRWLLPACLSLGWFSDVSAGRVPTANTTCHTLIATAEHQLKHASSKLQQTAAEHLLTVADAACGTAVTPAAKSVATAAPTANACKLPSTRKHITGAVYCTSGAGGFSGRVTAVGSGTGLADGLIGVYNSSGVLQKFVFTDGSGNYVVTGLLPGSYYTATSTGSTPEFLAEGFADVACPSGFGAAGTGLGSCSPANLTPIVVSAGNIRPNINFVLANNTGFIGRVSSGGLGLAGGLVGVYNSNGVLQKFLTTDSSGNYRATGLLPGTYYATTSLGSFNAYLAEGHGDVPCPSGFAPVANGLGSCSPANLTPIVVSAGAVIPNINFVLSDSTGFTGRVSSGGLGLDSGLVGVYNANGVLQKFVFTDASGNYRATGLIAGNYFAVTSPGSFIEFLAEAHSDLPCPSGFAATSAGLGSCSPANVTPITVAAGTIVSNIDFVLSNSTGFSGRVSGGGNGLSGLLGIYNANGVLQKFVFSDELGDYRATGLLPGSYYAVTTPGSFIDFLAEGNSDVPCPSGFAATSMGLGSCSPAILSAITVSAGNVTANINFSLSNSTGFSGRVTDAANGTGLSGLIGIYNSSGALQKFVFSDGNGDYRASGLLPGNHYAVTTQGAFLDYLPEAFRDRPCPSEFAATADGLGLCSPANSTPISVASGQITNAINFTLCRLSDSVQVFKSGFEP